MRNTRTKFTYRTVVPLTLGIGWLLAADGHVVVTAAEPPQIVERGPHSRKWERTTVVVLRDGRTVERKHSYTEIATGLNYQNAQGEWIESKEEIELFQGAAVARQGQHKAIFAANLNSPGAIELSTPDGKLFRSHVLGLVYTDALTGNSVLIAETKDSTGAVLPPNQVFYQDAFAGDCQADVRYTYTKAGFEQDIILLNAPPSPAEWGLNPETTRFEVFTEFLEAPDAIITSVVLKQEQDPLLRQLMAEPDLIDQHLDFGVMKMETGQAFPLGQIEPLDESRVDTGKSFERIDGRLFLIEKVDYMAIRGHLQRLPQAAGVNKDRKVARKPMLAGILPARPNGARGTWKDKQVARADLPRQGLILDYIAINSSMTNYTFKCDTTYHVTAAVGLYGTTVLEGTVLKFATNAQLTINGPLDCRTDPYRPATFLSKDDNTIGEIISGSTGTPLGPCAVYSLYLKDTSATYDIHDIRVFHSLYGVALQLNVKADLNNLQMGKAPRGITWVGLNKLTCRNFLFFDLTTAFYAFGTGTNRTEHGTIHRVGSFLSSTDSTRLVTLTNSLLISVTNNVVYSGANVVQSLDDTGFFQTVGSSTHYLASGSTNRNAGTTNINPDLLVALQQRTTYPPIVLTNHIVSDLTFSPQAQRDNDLPDLGYHIAPLDFVANSIAISNAATVRLSPGTVFGFYGSEKGLRLLQNAGLIAEGTPLNPCRFVRYNLSQEQANTNWSSPTVGSFVYTHANEADVWTARFRFTEWNAPAGGVELFLGEGDPFVFGAARLVFCDSHIRGGSVSAWAPEAAFTNCLFERANVLVLSAASDARNCTFVEGSLKVDGAYGTHEVADSLFDRTYFDTNAWFGTINHHNAYVTNENRLQPAGTNDVILLNTAYELGSLGRFYLPTNSALINTGSVSAASARLYHFTTTTNQVKETNSVVDIGFHYVAVNGSDQPIDTDGDGLPDCMEDTNGDGAVNSGETDWNNATDPGLRVVITRPRTGSNIP